MILDQSNIVALRSSNEKGVFDHLVFNLLRSELAPQIVHGSNVQPFVIGHNDDGGLRKPVT
jgi:hypothetical protein